MFDFDVVTGPVPAPRPNTPEDEKAGKAEGKTAQEPPPAQ
jgi:hypothetical protein